MPKQKTMPLKKSQKSAVQVVPVAERIDYGKALREIIARKGHSEWKPHSRRRDPIEILIESSAGRIPDLVPIRYGRMLASPFTFFRGSAAIMAADLAGTPTTGIKVQACGDCHLLNFGAFATPERNLIVDINDFDETLPAPWEWDLKRLATSFVLACRANGYKPAVCKEAAETVTRSYRTSMQAFSKMHVLDVWYLKMDLKSYIKTLKDEERRAQAIEQVSRQKKKSALEYLVPALTVEENGKRRFKDLPPLIYHSKEQQGKEFFRIAQETFANYKNSLSADRQVLLNRYELMDVAMKVVGIGSVGTYCAVLLLMASSDDSLILQIKEARPSVLEPYAGKSAFSNDGERVVIGQRLMQSQSDIFLGWTTGTGKYQRHFFLRQLKDMKMSLTPEFWTLSRALEVAEALGWVLARAHARSGDPSMISGYMGSKNLFDKAVADFADAYADQTERDHQMLAAAVKSGRISALIER